MRTAKITGPTTALLAGLILSTPAFAQNALGDGRGMENSTIAVTAPTNRTNTAESFLNRIRLRNAIVTGNAPGGLSFRGDLGYGAPGEFRGELGANDLFAFRRDALFSGLTGYGIRGTEATQWQFALTTGSRAPSGLLGSPSVRRFGESSRDATHAQLSTIPGFTGIDLRRSDPIEAEIRAMRAPGGTLLGSMRSTAAYTTARASTPTLLGSGENEAGQRFGVIASTLEGVRLKELELPTWLVRDDGTPRLSESVNRINPTSTSRQIDPTRTVYDDVLERLRTMPIENDAGGDISTKPAWEIRLDEIRERLAPLLPGADSPEDSGVGFSNEAIDLIRAAGGQASSLIVGGEVGTGPYSDHLRQGENMLSQGQYFDAEERFTRALSIRPGDVPAQIGRVHAQLGAGMYLSASLNLRSLLTTNPEITGVQYGPQLLPTSDRVRDIVSVLRGNARSEGQSTLQRESSLLLAYLGAQLGDRTMVAEGLTTMDSRASLSDRRLVSLLRGVWEGSGQSPGVERTNDPGR